MILRISTYSAQMWENADQNNSEHGHFSRSVLPHYAVATFKVLFLFCAMMELVVKVWQLHFQNGDATCLSSMFGCN